MAFAPMSYYSLLSVMVLLPALSFSQDPYESSRATYYGSPDCLGTPSGACGYGEYGRTVYEGNVAGVSKLFRYGAGCGACYQVRCKNPRCCAEDGVIVVATDYGEGDRTDFILSASAYARMARPNAVVELFAYGVVDIEYKRVPCRYPGHYLMVKVHEYSRLPQYLAIVILYQAGQNEITAVEVWQPDHQQWRGMRRDFGAVWDISNPPAGELTFRIHASGTWVQLNNVIPSEWKAGVAYNTTNQLN